jgi:hypothetical protein
LVYPHHLELFNDSAPGNFHPNASLTAVNLAKHEMLVTKEKGDEPFSMSEYKTMNNNNLMPERFIYMFAVNPDMPKNQRIVTTYFKVLRTELYY